ncbi:MAG TPA: DUF4202 domain-containing protein [Tepidiformaceae bacterium]|nr:DUF4202 domain-containing protein [Tepidiformaceae bacterium]
MSNTAPRLENCEAAIDLANRDDPTRVVFEGAEQPTALIEGIRAAAWVRELLPGASEPLLLGARAHHLRRWLVPRDSYPRTREGYHAWRSGLYDFHAEELGKLMRTAGYTDDEVARSARILRKQGIKSDPEVQAHEDAVSLAFIELRLAAFAPTVNDEQLVRALKRTLLKMSAEGRAAVGQLAVNGETAAILSRLGDV